MPQLIQYLDEIAREKQRAVLFLNFVDSSMELSEILNFSYERCKPFMDVTAWLKANDIKWQPCALQGEMVHRGRIYVDVPFDVDNSVYQKLADHLENPDGSMKIEGVVFLYMPLEMAMKYAYQDEPGYWDQE